MDRKVSSAHGPSTVPESQPPAAVPERDIPRRQKSIFIAGPCTPMGGGMFKVIEYLMQSSKASRLPGTATLLPLDTRGGGSAVLSIGPLLVALLRLVRGQLSGSLAGVHVNMAERLSLVRKGLIMAMCRALGVPVVLHLHAAQLHHDYAAFSRPVKALVRWLFSLPAHCVVLGKTSASFVIDDLKVPPERVEIVVNGVPEPKLARRDANERAGAPQRVLFVGNLSERKGVSDLLRALSRPEFARIPLELTCAGGGDLQRYRVLADSLGLGERVRFNGWSNQQAVAQLLAEADVMVLPSHDEGLPLAILEALAQGVAVVCTPVGEIPHVLTDGFDACFVRPGDPRSIADGLFRVLQDRDLRERLERNGRALYKRQFSLDHFSASVARIHMRHFGVSSIPADDPGQRENVA